MQFQRKFFIHLDFLQPPSDTPSLGGWRHRLKNMSPSKTNLTCPRIFAFNKREKLRVNLSLDHSVYVTYGAPTKFWYAGAEDDWCALGLNNADNVWWLWALRLGNLRRYSFPALPIPRQIPYTNNINIFTIFKFRHFTNSLILIEHKSTSN